MATRSLNQAIAILALLFLLPLAVATAIGIRLTSSGQCSAGSEGMGWVEPRSEAGTFGPRANAQTARAMVMPAPTIR